MHARHRSAAASLVAVAALVVALSACAGPAPVPPADPPAAEEPMSGHAAMAAPVLYAVQSGPLGVIVTDGDGRLLYRSEDDSAQPPTSRCTDACAEAWQPMTVDGGRLPEPLGVDPALVGTLTRPDGTAQVTLGGWPLYRDPADQGGLTGAGRHGEDGRWFVVTPTGDRATPPS